MDAVPGGDSGPLLLSAPKPQYPSRCVLHGEEGNVLCELHVDQVGRVSHVGVLRSSGNSELDQAARDALLRWRFEPAHEHGRPVRARIKHEVRFRLE